MISRAMIKLRMHGLVLLATLLPMSVALAGGFGLIVEEPSPSNDPRLKEVVLIVRPYGCKQPADAVIEGTAEGIVNGKRQSLPLRFTLTSHGVYAVKRQWPKEGVWVLAISGTYLGGTSSVLVGLGSENRGMPEAQSAKGDEKKLRVRTVQRALIADEVEMALKAMARQTTKPLQAKAAS